MLTVRCDSDGVNPFEWTVPEGVTLVFSGPDWTDHIVVDGPYEGQLPEPACPYDGDGCDGGILWPMATNGDNSHDWIERCDECQRYGSDRDAAIELGRRLGRHVKYAHVPGVRDKCPYIDKEEK